MGAERNQFFLPVLFPNKRDERREDQISKFLSLVLIPQIQPKSKTLKISLFSSIFHLLAPATSEASNVPAAPACSGQPPQLPSRHPKSDLGPILSSYRAELDQRRIFSVASEERRKNGRLEEEISGQIKILRG